MAEAAAISQGYRFGLRMAERGSVIGVGDGIAWIKGLPSARMDETLEFEDGSPGLVFQLDIHAVGAIILKQTYKHHCRHERTVHRAQRLPSVPATLCWGASSIPWQPA